MPDTNKAIEAFKNRDLLRSSLRLKVFNQETQKDKVLSLSQFRADAPDEAIKQMGEMMNEIIGQTCVESDVVSTFRVEL